MMVRPLTEIIAFRNYFSYYTDLRKSDLVVSTASAR